MRRFRTLDEVRSFVSSHVFPDRWSIYVWSEGDFTCYFAVPKVPSELRFITLYYPDAKEVI